MKLKSFERLDACIDAIVQQALEETARTLSQLGSSDDEIAAALDRKRARLAKVRDRVVTQSREHR